MVQVRVAAVVVDAQSQPVVVLKPVDEAPGEGMLLPIWIGVQEATAILLALEGGETSRPMVYDLVKRLLDSLGATVERVDIPRLEDGTYYAEITLRSADRVHVIDSRPSDSIALGLRMDAPIYVGEQVLESAGIPDETTESDDQDSEVAAFSDFLDSVNPEDFQG